jgi:hypothetical protein
MVSLSLDQSLEKPREFVGQNDLPWVQGYLGDWSRTDVPAQYGVSGIPALFLIDPAGKLVATEMDGASLGAELAKFLK